MTNATIDADTTRTFSLNEETVIVLKDYKNSLQQTVFTATGRDARGMRQYQIRNGELRINIFDGEGLIAPDYAEYISNFLRENYKLSTKSHSFQIRMPFTKGVLHDVDFNKFFSEQLNQENGKLLIEDMFGVTRDLRKAKIILTSSMLKCGGWMKKLNSLRPDPMNYFFKKVAEYDHALYVTNTESRLTNSGYIKLNHQFLSTLALTPSDLDSLIADQCQRINSFNEQFTSTLAGTFATQDAEEILSDNDEYDYSLMKDTSRIFCLKVVSLNSAFLRDPKVKTIYDEMLKNYECDLGRGRLEVEGEQKFFSCDLLYLLFEILCGIKNISIDDSQKELLKNQCLESNHFFMPENKIPIKVGSQYAFLRNPHLSRNEQVLLTAYADCDSLYEKYFSHLKCVVMISASSTAAMALGGADYDGDIVKIIADSRIIQAVQRGKYNAKLAPIQIPSSDPMTMPLGHTIPFKVIVDTFSSKVGEISNLAVKFAEKEYFSNSGNETYENVPLS